MDNNTIDATPVILAGGSGTRLWPLSRSQYPKQFLALDGDLSFLQQTERRVDEVFGSPPLLVCNEQHRFLTAEQSQQIGVVPGGILLEPAARNTAPAIAAAAWYCQATQGPDTLMAVFPSDHRISDLDGFRRSMQAAVDVARRGHLVTFGIRPDTAETGFGYIEAGDALPASEALTIERFVEKPGREDAQRYLESGRFYWNAGMFLFTAAAYLDALERFEPAMHAQTREAVDKRTTDLDFVRLDGDSYASVPANSIDYAVMEKTDKAVMVPLQSDWSDVGSWEAIYQSGTRDARGNVTLGDVILEDSDNCYVNATDRLVATVGVSNLSIVETTDCVLVTDTARSQDTKHIVAQLKGAKRQEADTHSVVYRPWGNYESLNIGNRYQVKRITVKPKQKLSLQKHFHRAEHWIVVTGTAIVTNGDEEIMLTENQSTYIPLGTVHRLENPGTVPLELIEVQSGTYLGEDDIVRLEDVYGRQPDGSD